MTGHSLQTLQADVLIIGGGLVGLTLACAIGQHGLSAVVVDAVAPGVATNEAFDGRCSAFSRTSKAVLEAVGLWQSVAAEAQPMLDIRVTDTDSPLFVHYDHNDIDGEPFGWMLENRALRRAHLARLAELPSVAHLAPMKVAALTRDAAGVEAKLSDGRRVHAALVVAADGRDSPTRAAAGIKTTTWNYNQTGIVCTVAHEYPHNAVAQERFLPSGPFAILPLTGNRSSLVWAERTDLVDGIMALSEEDFLDELRRRFGDHLGRLQVEGRRWAYPLSVALADTYVAQRLVLAGDAAHGMHPVAGQGLNMGLRDVAALAEVLVETRRLGLDIGADPVLKRYQRWRRFDNLMMVGMTDGLVRLFSNSIGPVKVARTLGLAVVNRLPQVKQFFMRHAMGMVGELPRLMRGEQI